MKIPRGIKDMALLKTSLIKMQAQKEMDLEHSYWGRKGLNYSLQQGLTYGATKPVFLSHHTPTLIQSKPGANILLSLMCPILLVGLRITYVSILNMCKCYHDIHFFLFLSFVFHSTLF